MCPARDLTSSYHKTSIIKKWVEYSFTPTNLTNCRLNHLKNVRKSLLFTKGCHLVMNESKQQNQRSFVDRRQFCRCIIGVSSVPRGPYCMCKTKMAACALRIKCCVLESCCSFDGRVPSRSTVSFIAQNQNFQKLKMTSLLLEFRY